MKCCLLNSNVFNLLKILHARIDVRRKKKRESKCASLAVKFRWINTQLQLLLCKIWQTQGDDNHVSIALL